MVFFQKTCSSPCFRNMLVIMDIWHGRLLQPTVVGVPTVTQLVLELVSAKQRPPCCRRAEAAALHLSVSGCGDPGTQPFDYVQLTFASFSYNKHGTRIQMTMNHRWYICAMPTTPQPPTSGRASAPQHPHTEDHAACIIRKIAAI
jgi:hypothetical protein